MLLLSFTRFDPVNIKFLPKKKMNNFKLKLNLNKMESSKPIKIFSPFRLFFVRWQETFQRPNTVDTYTTIE